MCPSASRAGAFLSLQGIAPDTQALCACGNAVELDLRLAVTHRRVGIQPNHSRAAVPISHTQKNPPLRFAQDPLYKKGGIPRTHILRQ